MHSYLDQDLFELISNAFDSLRFAIAEHTKIQDREPILRLAADAQSDITELIDNFRELITTCETIPAAYNEKDKIFSDVNTLEHLIGAIGFHAFRANLALIYLSALADPELAINSVLHPKHPKFYNVFNLLKRILANPILDREHRKLEKFIQANLSNIENIDWSNIHE